MPGMFLDDVIKGICIAIKDAQEAIDLYQLDQYKKCFAVAEGEEAAGQAPRMLSLPIPQGDGSYKAKEIPIVTLMHHDSLHLDEVRFRMAVDSSWDEETSRMRIDMKSLSGETASDADNPKRHQEIELVFKRGESSEAVARLKDVFVKTI
jgi:hypothetical protein